MAKCQIMVLPISCKIPCQLTLETDRFYCAPEAVTANPTVKVSSDLLKKINLETGMKPLTKSRSRPNQSNCTKTNRKKGQRSGRECSFTGKRSTLKLIPSGRLSRRQHYYRCCEIVGQKPAQGLRIKIILSIAARLARPFLSPPAYSSIILCPRPATRAADHFFAKLCSAGRLSCAVSTLA